ncbi:unnamed protein product [Trichobilharzia regenti]|nr:unnamed protein product [Trichobilharzia regenti]
MKLCRSNAQLTAELSPVDSMKRLTSDLSMKIKWTTKDKHVGGLGWIPNRQTQCKRLSESKHSVGGDKEGEEEEGEGHVITDDDEILKALPGLKKSRLIGDHCTFTFCLKSAICLFLWNVFLIYLLSKILIDVKLIEFSGLEIDLLPRHLFRKYHQPQRVDL